MKKVFKNVMFLLTIMISLVLVACGGDKTTTSTSATTTKAQTTANTGTTTSGSTTAEDTTPVWEGFPADDLKGEKIIIMCGVITECDPNEELYSGTDKEARLAIQARVEQKYNVVIDYQVYPTAAVWGPVRVDEVIKAYTAGKPLAHIYQLTNQWAPQLAKANAITPVTEYVTSKYTHPLYDETQITFGSYNGDVYGFDSGYALNDASGLYYNYDLLKELKLESPAKLWNEGKWTWAKFEELALAAQAKFNENPDNQRYAVGGHQAQWAENFIPANGGSLIDPYTNEVSFVSNRAINAVNFLNQLYNKGVWEPSTQVEADAGGAGWLGGNVLFHFGELWFVKSEIRWGGDKTAFKMGYVPWPVGNDVQNFEDEYMNAKFGQTMWYIAGGYEDTTKTINKETIYKVWAELQNWQPLDDTRDAFRIKLSSTYDDPESVAANISVIDKVYNEQIFMVVGGWGEGQWYRVAQQAVMTGDVNSKFTAMKQLYDGYLVTYLQK